MPTIISGSHTIMTVKMLMKVSKNGKSVKAVT